MYATSNIDSRARRCASGGGTASIPAPARSHSRAAEGTWPLPHRPEAAADARRIARSVLDGRRIGDGTVDAVLTVVSELVTNAVEHARAPVHLHLHNEAGGRVWVGVSDGGPAEQDGSWTRSCTADEHGRGLAVVRALADRFGTRSWAGGRTTRWARVARTGV